MSLLIEKKPAAGVPAAEQGRRRPARRTGAAGRFAVSGFLWVYAAIAVPPPLVMVFSSLRTTREMARNPLALPLNPNFASYTKAWVQASFGTFFTNSLLVTIGSVLISTVVSLLAAYALARSKSRVTGIIEAVFLSGLMLPVYLAILPVFYLLDGMGLVDNKFGLIMLYAALSIPFSVFVLTSFFRQLPVELEEAARIDGAGSFTMFWHIMLPLVKPAIATVVVFRFVPIWNDFFYPLILMRSKENYTLPVGLTTFFGEYQTDWPTLFAGLVIATIPLVVLFLVATKQIVAGLTAGMSK
ncbi:carbohydrate ABC transporter permease [uncultured Arthrobacter sp.]|uniref:carbohydrate ABC transporter permease n=1 Tax=uncultured Arthrobacter sp. TaxID=114050 RepID=UPI0032180DC3